MFFSVPTAEQRDLANISEAISILEAEDLGMLPDPPVVAVPPQAAPPVEAAEAGADTPSEEGPTRQATPMDVDQPGMCSDDILRTITVYIELLS